MNLDRLCKAKRQKPKINTVLKGAAGGSQLLSTIFSPDFQEKKAHLVPAEIRIMHIGKRKIIDKMTSIHALPLRDNFE